MTNNLTLRALDIPPMFSKFGVGFDSMLDDLERFASQQSGTNYPPYNIIKQGENTFAIELAVAGFKEGDINVEVERNQLTVRGEQSSSIDKPIEYVHRGISARNFVRSWTLADHIVVNSAFVQDGILTINLERVVPESERPKQIKINYNK